VKRRLITSYLALTLVVLGVLEIPLAVNYEGRLRKELEANLQRDAFVLASFSEETLEGRGTLDLQQLATNYGDRTGGRVVIVDKNGLAEADSNPPDVADGSAPRSFADRPEIAAALDRQVSVGTRASETLGTDLLYVAVPIVSGGKLSGAVRITYSTSDVQARVYRYWLVLAGIGAVSLAAAAAVGALLARWVVRPVEELRIAATRVGGGDLAARASTTDGPPEIRELATAFNDTATRLEELVTAQEQFVADASHQLRTPLTALRLRLEMLEDDAARGDLDHDQASDDLAAARAEVQRLSRLVDGLLALARAERTAATATAEPIALDDVLAERRQTWEPVAAERDVTLAGGDSDATARATPDRLIQVIDNLLANALEVSPPGSTILLTATTPHPAAGGEPVVAVHVVDEGPGMSSEQRHHAFDRFWRASAERGDLGGSGLGLSIVRKLVRADGGDIELHEAAGGGIDAVVTLPAGPDRARPADRPAGARGLSTT